MALALDWVKHLRTPADKEAFIKKLLSGRTALQRLTELMVEDGISLTDKEVSETDFEDPNWSHKQAFRNGQRSVLKKYLRIMASTRKEKE